MARQKKVSWDLDHEKLKRDIRKRLFVRGMSQADLAKALGYKPQTIRSYLSGGDTSKLLACKIIEYLKLTMRVYMTKTEEDLCLDGEEQPKKSNRISR